MLIHACCACQLHLHVPFSAKPNSVSHTWTLQWMSISQAQSGSQSIFSRTVAVPIKIKPFQHVLQALHIHHCCSAGWSRARQYSFHVRSELTRWNNGVLYDLSSAHWLQACSVQLLLGLTSPTHNCSSQHICLESKELSSTLDCSKGMKDLLLRVHHAGN